MRILGLVTEYNPFHNGHLHHLQASMEKTDAVLTIAVMSGHFLQRGLPALTDKWTRAKMAIRCGVDLVIELPALYACASAEHFASGSVALLHGLGAECLCFGSEDGDIGPLQKAAEVLATEPPAFKEALRNGLDKGLSFPEARDIALQAVLPNGGPHLNRPNTILGLEYCKAIQTQGIAMTPYTIPRIGTGYHSTDRVGGICSATAIRAMLRDTSAVPDFHAVMPPTAAAQMEAARHTGNTGSEDRLLPMLRYLLRSTPPEQGLMTADCEHGLWNRLTEAAHTAQSFEELIQHAKTRRYTLTRIQRVLMALLLGIRADTRKRLGPPRYARVLGASAAGRRYLRSYTRQEKLPVITNLSRFHTDDPLLKEMLAFDVLATDLFSLTLEAPELRTYGKDYLIRKPYMGE